MGTRYRPYEPEQPFLLPPSLLDWLPQDHLAYFISDTIDQLDLSVLHQRYQGDGRRNQPYHPTMLAKVLIYAYATGVFSSRKIAAKLIEDVALRVLAAGNRPDFRTINRFGNRTWKRSESSSCRCCCWQKKWACCGWGRWRWTARKSRPTLRNTKP